MKLKKLNARGFSHDIIIVLFVVIFAIAGVGYLVASHADNSCSPTSGPSSSATSDTVSDPTSDASSSPVCQPTSSPTSTPTSAPTTPATKLTASCVINGVPANPSYGQVLYPSATISVSSGQGSYNPTPVYAAIYPLNGNRAQAQRSTVQFPSAIAGGSSATVSLPKYTVGYGPQSGVPDYQEYQLWWNSTVSEINCAASFALAVPPSVKLAGSCQIYDLPQSPSYTQRLQPYVGVTDTGSGAYTAHVQSTLAFYNQQGHQTTSSSSQLSTPAMSPHQTYRLSLAQYTTPRATSNQASGTYTITSSSPQFSCSASFELPSN
jgi:hypothetical protein